MILTSYEICKNCKYYVPLYVKDKDRFKTIIGYCVYSAKTARNRQKPFTDGKQCEFKEQQENNIDEQNKSVRQVILKMQNQLTQILNILQREK